MKSKIIKSIKGVSGLVTGSKVNKAKKILSKTIRKSLEGKSSQRRLNEAHNLYKKTLRRTDLVRSAASAGATAGIYSAVQIAKDTQKVKDANDTTEFNEAHINPTQMTKAAQVFEKIYKAAAFTNMGTGGSDPNNKAIRKYQTKHTSNFKSALGKKNSGIGSQDVMELKGN